MTCPHCGFENQEGRRYCRGCAKALAAPQAVAPSETDSADSPPVDASSVDSSHIQAPSEHAPSERSHDASFSLVMPDSGISRNVVVIAAALIVVIGGVAFWFVHGRNMGRDARAATAQNSISAANQDAASQETRDHVIAALRLIVAQQDARLADDPDDLNVCATNVFGSDELGRHVRQSHYIFDQQCQPRTADGRAIRNGFTITAIPKIDDNPSDAPAYCVDQTKIIRRYTDSAEVSNSTNVQHLTCPLDGQPLQ